jgi:hypothetical protein
MNLRLRPDVTTTDTEHGTVLLDERNGRYWQLNPTGTRILHALLADQPPERVAAALAARHGLPPERARADVTAITDRLRAANLVTTS